MNRQVRNCALWLGALVCPGVIYADASPWLPIPRTLEVNVSQVVQESTEFYRGTDRRGLPFGRFDQSTTWIGVKYGLSDKFALDFRGGTSNLDAGALGENRDTVDWTVGITHSFLDEIEHGTPSVAVRIAAIIAGDYEVGRPNSVGDGADALQVNIAVGKVISARWALAADLGLKFSSDDVPQETMFNAGANFQASDRIGFYAQYQLQRSDGSLDIGESGFTPAAFPETEEEYDRVRVGVGFSATPELRLDFSYYDTLDGRNTADFDAYSLTVSYTHDMFRM